jgi:hypothetical protein
LAKGARLNEGSIRSAALLAWIKKSKVDGGGAAALQDIKQALPSEKLDESLDE